MNKLLTFIAVILLSFSAMAEHHESAAEVRDAVKAFNGTYGSNMIKDYFSYFTDDASLFWDGARQQVAVYREQWTELIESGGAVEKNDLSDVQVRLLPGGNAAVATYFIAYRLRLPDGEISESNAFETDVWQKIDGDWKVVSVHYTEIPPE